jgi:chromosome segregation ATPase
LIASDQRSSEQTRLIAELTAKTEHHGEAMESLREKWHTSSAESRSLSSRLESSERRLREMEEQNRELMSVASRKEENVERLQSRVEELIQEASSLTAQLEGARSDAKRTQEHIKDRAASKVSQGEGEGPGHPAWEVSQGEGEGVV